MDKLLNQQELEQAILALQPRSELPDQSLTIGDVRNASPYVLALLSTLKIVLAPMGDRKIKIGGISVTVSDLLNALIGGLTGVSQ